MDRAEFILERSKAAREYFHQGYNCCQSVLLAFQDMTSLEPDSLAKAGAGMGGGVGRLREVCGAVSAMGIISGFLLPYSPGDNEAKKNNYALVQNLSSEFKSRNGSIVCRELLGLRQVAGKPDPAPAPRTEGYYHSRPCEKMVGDSAEILAAYVFDNLKP